MNASDPSALVGRVLAGRYRILTCLGDGAMGAVYLAEHLRIGRQDAIKVLRPEIAQDREAIARFARGARNVSAIRHPNVCTIYDFSDTEDGLQYLAMEYVAGRTLKSVLDEERRLAPERALRIALHVAAALQAAHDAGIVHRDLKPANVMITPLQDGSDEVKVVDFDIAKGPEQPEGEEVTRLGFVVGTPEYMSPEQLMGERLDGRSDLYSLGVMLFRMLTGALPFRAVSTQEIMVQRLTVQPLTLRDVLPDVEFPPAIDSILARAQMRQREDRYPDAAAFGRDLAAALQSMSPVAAMPAPRVANAADEVPATVLVSPPAMKPAAGSAVPQPVKSKRPLLAAGIATVVLLAAGATVLMPRFTNGIENTTPPVIVDDDDPGVLVGEAASTGTTAPNTIEAQSAGEVSMQAEAPRESRPQVERPAVTQQPERIGALLDRQRSIVASSPGAARLQAARDTVLIAWHRSTTRADSTDAAAILAEAALLSGELEECRRWGQRGSVLNPEAFSVLRQIGCPW